MKTTLSIKRNYTGCYIITTSDLRLVGSLSRAINRWRCFHVDSMYIDGATSIYIRCISDAAKPRKWNVYLQYSIYSVISLYSSRLYPVIGYIRRHSIYAPSYAENHWILIEIFPVVYQLRSCSFSQSSPWITSNISISWNKVYRSPLSKKIPLPLTLLHAKFHLHCFYPRRERAVITPRSCGECSLSQISPGKDRYLVNGGCIEAITGISCSCWEVVY